jgi:hypothetical protein
MSKKAAATGNSSANPSTTSTVHPEPTIRMMIVCVPDDLPGAVFDRRQLDRHFGVQGSIAQRFWAKPTAVWNRRLLVDARKGRPTPCAGGPLRLLDLVALRHAYGVGAGVRHQTFTRVVRGTRDARPWVSFVQRYLDDPDTYPMDKAEADFHNQPRVLAMRTHNAVTYGAGRLEQGELEMLQAGPVAYSNYQCLTAVAADTILTPDGERMAPATDRFADRLTYLEQANHYLDTLDDDTRVVAVQI